MIKIREIYNYLDEIAPFKNQESTDNSGLLVGDMDVKAGKILVCLDVTNAVVAEAIDGKADLIISHHPLMYLGIKRVLAPDPLHPLIAGDISFIATHTNMDVAEDGVTDLMLRLLGFPTDGAVMEVVNPDGTGFGKAVSLEKTVSARELAKKCKAAFESPLIRYVDSGKPVKKLGLCSGGGSALVETAYDMGCDAYICGDLRWDRMVFAANYGMTLIDAGHFHTEDIFCADMVQRLKSRFPEISVTKATNSVDVCNYM
jgi:dinuclear metal center YbgI/SA1388 family protein